uniref:MFS domain-containing protein n=1 Tax=Macrostomum lignano TaxID=282301 RepID=A0A1I8GER4_9PLAT
ETSLEREEVTPLSEQDSEINSANECGVAYKAPDGGWGWVVVFSSFFIHVLMDGFTFSYGVIAAELALDEAMGVSRQLNGWTSSVLTGIKLGGSPLVSLVSRRFGNRPVTMVGACVAAAGLALSYFAVKPLMYLPSMVIVGLYFDKRRSTAMGIAFGGSGLGMFALGPLMEYLMDVYSWRGALLVLAGIMLNGVVFASLMRPLPKRPRAATEAASSASAENKSSSDHLSRLKTLLSDRNFQLFLLSQLVFDFGFDTPFLYAPDRARKAGHSGLLAALLISIMGASNVAGRFGFGFVLDRLARCKCAVDKTAMQGVTMLGAGLAALGAVLSESYVVMVAHGVAYGLFIGAIFDATRSFDASYLTAAAFMLIGSFIVMPLPWLVKQQRATAEAATAAKATAAAAAAAVDGGVPLIDSTLVELNTSA